jgi:hypothetical protein
MERVDQHWEVLQQRSIALTGKLMEDLTPEEASVVAQRLTVVEKSLILERLYKSLPKTKRRPQTYVSQRDVVRYRRAVKAIRLRQQELRKLRRRILGSLREGC